MAVLRCTASFFSIMEEIWKTVEGWEPIKVSNLGRVKGVRGNIAKTQRSSKKNGEYEWLYLQVNGVRKYMSVHRLVATAFIPNPEFLPVVMHIDDNPYNNKAENLKWGTYRDNTHDSIRKGRFKIVQNTKRGPRGNYRKKD